MKIVNKKINPKIYEVSQKLGFNLIEINNLINNIESENEHLSFAAGPDPYWGGMYGIIGIKDFSLDILH